MTIRFKAVNETHWSCIPKAIKRSECSCSAFVDDTNDDCSTSLGCRRRRCEVFPIADSISADREYHLVRFWHRANQWQLPMQLRQQRQPVSAFCPLIIEPNNSLSSCSWSQSIGEQSGRQDSNLRPSAPKAPALPSCATPRYPSIVMLGRDEVISDE